MLKAAFIAQLEAAVTEAATQELGPAWSILGCPYIERYFNHYGNQSAAHVEAVIHRYAPETQGATSARAYIAPVVAHVRAGVRSWRETGASSTPGSRF